MREILFRGKRRDNGEWVYGSLFVGFQKSYICPEAIAMYNFDGALCLGGFVEVYPETVGQYTGMKDKNGKRIFEGDILRWTGEDGETGKVIVIFAGGSYLLKCVEVLDAPADLFDEFDRGGQTLEVIGNIHDNPELLEGGDEG